MRYKIMRDRNEGTYRDAAPYPRGAIPTLPGEVLRGVLIRIESPPGVGPGILGIVRRSEIGDQSSGWTGHQGKHSVDYSAVLVISGCNVQFWEAGFSDGRG